MKDDPNLVDLQHYKVGYAITIFHHETHEVLHCCLLFLRELRVLRGLKIRQYGVLANML